MATDCKRQHHVSHHGVSISSKTRAMNVVLSSPCSVQIVVKGKTSGMASGSTILERVGLSTIGAQKETIEVAVTFGRHVWKRRDSIC